MEDWKKKYEEITKRVKELHESGNALTKSQMEIICPELAESEDERIRRKMVEHFKSKTKETWCNIPVKDIIAYLERQKEFYSLLCKTIKDKIREYISNHFITDTVVKTDVRSIVKAMEEGVRLGKEEQKPVVIQVENPNILKLDPNVVIETRTDGTASSLRNVEEEQKPAEWKPEPESLEALMYAIEGKWEMIKPTSYLSRRLEDLYEGLVNTFSVDESLIVELPKTAYSAKDIEELKAMKRKIEESMEQKPVARENDFMSKSAEWSEEDKEMLLSIINAFRNGTVSTIGQEQWLKSLPERFNLQPKQEWSEEDEKTRDWLIQQLDYMLPNKNGFYYLKARPWLKSLRPQHHWKLSKEQMEALSWAINYLTDIEQGCASTLALLKFDLKKLM